jgi:hypothetical protein
MCPVSMKADKASIAPYRSELLQGGTRKGYISVQESNYASSSCMGLGVWCVSNSDAVVFAGVLDAAACELPPNSLTSGLTDW